MRRRERERGGGADNPLPGHTRLPVLLSPPELRFCLGDPRTQRDVLTLYNPHAFALSYRVQCTAPSLYSVVQAEGSVAPSSCVDIVVRHRDKTQPHCGHADRFRVEVRAAGGASGCREVPAVVGQEPPPRRGRRLSGRAELQTQAGEGKGVDWGGAVLQSSVFSAFQCCVRVSLPSPLPLPPALRAVRSAWGGVRRHPGTAPAWRAQQCGAAQPARLPGAETGLRVCAGAVDRAVSSVREGQVEESTLQGTGRGRALHCAD